MDVENILDDLYISDSEEEEVDSAAESGEGSDESESEFSDSDESEDQEQPPKKKQRIETDTGPIFKSVVDESLYMFSSDDYNETYDDKPQSSIDGSALKESDVDDDFDPDEFLDRLDKGDTTDAAVNTNTVKDYAGENSEDEEGDSAVESGEVSDESDGESSDSDESEEQEQPPKKKQRIENDTGPISNKSFIDESLYMFSSDDYDEDYDDKPQSSIDVSELKDSDIDEDFDPDEYLDRLDKGESTYAAVNTNTVKDDGGANPPSPTPSFCSSVSSTVSASSWRFLLTQRPKKPLQKKRKNGEEKYVRVSQAAVTINALEKELESSLASMSTSLAHTSLSSKSSKLAIKIVERASISESRLPPPSSYHRHRSGNFIVPPALSSRIIVNAAKSNIGASPSEYKPRPPPNIEFVREIQTVISSYLSQVFLQRAMNNNNNNSSGYYEDMVHKMINIINCIPRDEMTQEKYESVVRDALYVYYTVVSKITGPKHLKRLRTPKQQAMFCYLIAMLANGIPIDSDLALAGRSTSLVQFSSAMNNKAYKMAVHLLSNVFNNSYSVNKALNLDKNHLLTVNLILSMLSVRNTALCERKPRTLAQGVYLFYDYKLRDRLRVSGLTSEESSLGAAVRLVAQQLAIDGISKNTIEDGFNIMSGHFSVGGSTLKSLGSSQKDIKIVGSTMVLNERLRKEARTIAIQ